MDDEHKTCKGRLIMSPIGDETVIDRCILTNKHSDTGRTVHYKGGTILPRPFELRIVKYPGADGYYLIRLDNAGKELTDTYHSSVSDAKRQAEFELRVALGDWETA